MHTITNENPSTNVEKKSFGYFKDVYLSFIATFNELDKEFRLVILAIIVGLLGGLGAFLLRLAVYIIYLVIIQLPLNIFIDYMKFNPFISAVIAILFASMIGGMMIGIINLKFPPIKGDHGIPQIINAVENNQGQLPYKFPLLSLLKSAITIGTGGSTGREGPIVQIGGGSGSIVGRVFKVTPEEKRNLVISGVAAGIAATFNAPLGGIMFAAEVLHSNNRYPPLIQLVISSVVGTAVGIILIGQHPFLNFPNIPLTNPTIPSFLTYSIMGALLGVLSIIWIKGFHKIEHFFSKQKFSPIVKGSIGGMLIGIIYTLLLCLDQLSSLEHSTAFFYFPIWIDAQFLGYSISGLFSNAVVALNNAFILDPSITIVVACVLFVVTFVGNGITLGSGGSGGSLAPTLFMGVMFGFIFSNVLIILGVSNVNIPLLEVLAMAAFFAGTFRIPLTDIIMTAEVTGDFLIIIPIMFAVASAWIISRMLQQDDFFTTTLKLKHIIRKPTYDFLEITAISEIMTKNVITVSPKDRIETVIGLIKETGHSAYPVVSEGGYLEGIITSQDIESALKSGNNMDTWIVNN